MSIAMLSPLLAAIGQPGAYWNVPGHWFGLILLVAGVVGTGLGLYLGKLNKRLSGAIIGLLVISLGMAVSGVVKLT